MIRELREGVGTNRNGKREGGEGGVNRRATILDFFLLRQLERNKYSRSSFVVSRMWSRGFLLLLPVFLPTNTDRNVAFVLSICVINIRSTTRDTQEELGDQKSSRVQLLGPLDIKDPQFVHQPVYGESVAGKANSTSPSPKNPLTSCTTNTDARLHHTRLRIRHRQPLSLAHSLSLTHTHAHTHTHTQD